MKEIEPIKAEFPFKDRKFEDDVISWLLTLPLTDKNQIAYRYQNSYLWFYRSEDALAYKLKFDT